MTHKALFALLLLSACASAPTYEPIANGTDIRLSREIVLKGVTGGMRLDPMIARRDYTFTCTTGADAEARAKKALARTVQVEGSVGSQAIGMRYQESWERERVNPTITAEFGCQITRSDTSKVSTEALTVMRFVVDHNLLAELAK